MAGLAGSLPVLFAAQALLGFASGMLAPLLMGMSIEKVGDSERATAMGLHQAVYAIGMFAGPWLSGELAEIIGIQPMFVATGVVCLFISMGAGQFLRRK
jgi:MFS family permease